MRDAHEKTLAKFRSFASLGERKDTVLVPGELECRAVRRSEDQVRRRFEREGSGPPAAAVATAQRSA